MIEVLNKYSCLPFSYGNDCCSFAGEVVASLTGYNPMTAFDYEDERGAMKAIAQHGTLEDAMRATLGDPYDGHEDGDVCLIETDDGIQAAAVIHRNGVVAREKGGLIRYPLNRALMVWQTHG